MYQALYRKYRPHNFNEVVGQKVIVKTLMNAIKNNQITHAYLFTGPRGTGKTSIAKIFAKTINCENPQNYVPCDECDSCIQFNNKQTVDIIEIDAASNNGVDEIREIKNKVNLVPTNGKYKVYIIDEVHMLTIAAFNAMLKTLEEPPKNVIFILATTEPHKIPLTILSRCQRYDFKRLANSEIEERLSQIIRQENIKVEDGVINLIANISNGGMRDSIGLLDQLITYCDGEIKVEDIHEINGSLDTEQIYGFTMNLISEKYENVYNEINKYENDGKNLSIILEQLIEFLKNVLIYSNCPKYFNDEKLSEKYENVYSICSEEQLYKIIDSFLELNQKMKSQNNKKMLFEISIAQISRKSVQSTINKADNENEKEEINQKKEKDNNLNKVWEIKDKIEKIQEIRINNTLSKFDKKELIKMKNNLPKINNYLNDTKYSSIASLILGGELKALGNNYLIFVYKNETLEQLFNSELILLENLLYDAYNVKYKVIAVNNNRWEIIKNEFNKSMKENKNQYVFKEENYDLEDIFKISTEKKQIVKNDIDKMFGEIVEYR